MGGVDLHDWNLSKYNIAIRGKKYWCLLTRMFGMTVVNALMLHKVCTPNGKAQLSQLEFRREIAISYLRSSSRSSACLPTSPALVPQSTSLGAEEIALIERATKGQRTNPNWSRARKGRLTASNIGAVLVVRGRKPSASLLKTLTAGNFLGRVAAIQWGVTHEKDTIELFEKHFDVKVDQSGIWLHESGVLGASPDGMIGASEIIEVKSKWGTPGHLIMGGGVVRKKCPFSARGGLLDENQEYYLDATCDPGSTYYHQVQGNLCLTGRDVCYLVVWAPGEMVVVTVRKDPAWAQNLDTLIAFFDEHRRPDRAVTSANSPLLLCVLREGEPSEE
ncbi:uncharacterized protein LOC122369180 [Amphibalanus amphitrite]|uniref:uncharacterized protein LOC122369180 n=1 Tax=Amphibalanus amphitrite TaxID=1232801 RepID=UPI001C91DEE9|nr:uncharacterized protein LOC122369180 [Amphibalanus amphitrite]